MIPVQRFHHLPQPLVAVILVIPHILVVFDLALLIERQSHKTIYRLCEMHEPRCVFLFHFEDDLVWVGGGVGDDFGGEGAGGGHYFGDAWDG